MSTSYVVFCQAYDDPVWGQQVIDWVHTGLVRVYRNRMRKAVFEWVGNPGFAFDLEQIRRSYPICKYAITQDPPLVSYRKRIPFPDRKLR